MTAQHSRHFQPTQLRGVNRDLRTVDIVASDFSLDSYNTRIDPNGWDLEQLKENPVICLQHDSYSKLPVAAAIPESIRVENGRLLMTPQFPPEGTTADADEAFGLVAAGILRGVSVGFDPIEWDDVEEMGSDNRPMMVRIYRKQRLMEVSFVTIPSNDNGLVVRAREQGHDEKAIVRSTEKLEESLKARGPQTIDDALALIGDSPAKDLLIKHSSYSEQKQPVNKVASRVMGKFFKRVLDEEPPAEEKEAWEKMEQAVEATQPTKVPITQEEETQEAAAVTETPAEAPEAAQVEQPQGEPVAAVEEPTPESTPPVPEAPEPERKASVHMIPVSVLLELPGRMARTYVDAGVEALRRGTLAKEVDSLIDGLNGAVTLSISTHIPNGK